MAVGRYFSGGGSRTTGIVEHHDQLFEKRQNAMHSAGNGPLCALQVAFKTSFSIFSNQRFQ